LLEALKKGKDISTVKGIVFKKQGNLIKTAPAPNIENLDNLPFPARELLPMDKYRKLIF